MPTSYFVCFRVLVYLRRWYNISLYSGYFLLYHSLTLFSVFYLVVTRLHCLDILFFFGPFALSGNPVWLIRVSFWSFSLSTALFLLIVFFALGFSFFIVIYNLIFVFCHLLSNKCLYLLWQVFPFILSVLHTLVFYSNCVWLPSDFYFFIASLLSSLLLFLTSVVSDPPFQLRV